MPYDVQEKRRADSLMRGARVMLRQDGKPLVVQAAERKIKYTYLTFGVSIDGATVVDRMRYANEDTLTTLSEKLTEAEELARDYQRAQRWASSELATGTGRVPADKLTEIAQNWRDGQYKGHVLDWSEGTSFFKIQAIFKMWQTIQHTLERLRELYGDENVSPLTAVVLELDNRDHERQNYVPNDPTSRSTNVLSNLVEALDRWSWETLADSARYQLAPEVQKRELARLTDMAERRIETR